MLNLQSKMDEKRRKLDISHDVEIPTTSTQPSVESLQHEQDNKCKYYLISWSCYPLLHYQCLTPISCHRSTGGFLTLVNLSILEISYDIGIMLQNGGKKLK